MKRIWMLLPLLLILAIPADALEIEAPEVPASGRELMPQENASFAEGLLDMVKKGIDSLYPELIAAVKIWVSVICASLLVAVLDLGDGKMGFTAKLAGALAISLLLLKNTDAMIRLASDTVTQICDYGKLLLPVMASALAAQGGITGSGGLYLGTVFFTSLLNNLFSGVFLGGIYFFLALSIANAAMGDSVLQRMKELIKNLISWCLKTILTVFTTYMSITGTVSGSTDAAALKAVKVGISSFVPVVGGILADASESVLIGAGILKNSAGIYGIFALLSLFLGPFIKIGVQYLLIKLASLVSSIWGSGSCTALIDDFSTALGMMLGITGSVCLLQLISTVCFLQGVRL